MADKLDTSSSSPYKGPERFHEFFIQSFDAKDNIEVLRGSKGDARFFHGQIAGRPADKNRAIGIFTEIITKDLKPFYHFISFIMWSIEDSIRSSWLLFFRNLSFKR